MTDPLGILVGLTLWSALITGISFGLSRHAPRSPNFWLAAIALCFAPFIVGGMWLALRPDTVPYVMIEKVSPILSVASVPTQTFPSVTTLLLWAYSGIALLGTGLTLSRFIRLAKLAPAIDGVASVPADIPPSALSWPVRKILMPEGLNTQSRTALIAHERAHMARLDPELTLVFCLAGNVLWINRPLVALIGAWRDAIELRADDTALRGADAPTRRAYAQTLLSAIAVQSKRRGRARPCPSAALIPNQKRRTEMRLQSILSPKAARKSPIRVFALGLGAAMLTGVGTLGVASAAQSTDRDAMPIKRTPPVFPTNCESDAPLPITIKNDTFYTTNFVNLKFDVDVSGVPINIESTASSAKCFEASAIAAVKQWRYEPKLQNGTAVKRKGVENKIAFRQIAEFKGDPSFQLGPNGAISGQSDEVEYKTETGIE